MACVPPFECNIFNIAQIGTCADRGIIVINLDKNDPIVTQILINVPSEFHAFLEEVLDAGVSRQKFKMFKCAIDNGKSMGILEQIKKCDFETADGFAEAVNLSGVHTLEVYK